MRTLLLVLALAPALASAQAQASASFSINLPFVLPQLVIVQPGIQVVPDLDVEVFHADGFYWTRHEGRWYRSNNHRGGWVYMERGVPPGLSRMPPGKYRRWRPAGRPAPRPAVYRSDDRRDGHDDHDRGGKGHGKKQGKRD